MIEAKLKEQAVFFLYKKYPYLVSATPKVKKPKIVLKKPKIVLKKPKKDLRLT